MQHAPAGIPSTYFRMLIHEFLKKDPDIVLLKTPKIILDSKFSVCMANNVKDNKHKNNIAKIVHFLRNGEI